MFAHLVVDRSPLLLVKAILIWHFLAGLSLAFAAPVWEEASVVAVWSDCQAFQGRGAVDEAEARILNDGGENPNESFEQLLERLRHLLRPTPFPAVGLLISVTSCSALPR